jgi:hypothetical protein
MGEEREKKGNIARPTMIKKITEKTDEEALLTAFIVHMGYRTPAKIGMFLF